MNETEIILGMLGDSSNKIANRLEAMGITGVQCRSDLCPVSEFLKDVAELERKGAIND